MASDSYEQKIEQLYNDRIGTLANIKLRSVDADVLTLSALRVLVYAQLEGGVKDQVAIVIRQINADNLQIGELAPSLLKWRNGNDLGQFKSAITFDNFAFSFPFANLAANRTQIKPLNRIKEFNQMNFRNLRNIYSGLGLDQIIIQQSASAVDDLVGARNNVAHHGIMPNIAKEMLGAQVRTEANIIGEILTDSALQMLTYFNKRLHRR